MKLSSAPPILKHGGRASRCSFGEPSPCPWGRFQSTESPSLSMKSSSTSARIADPGDYWIFLHESLSRSFSCPPFAAVVETNKSCELISKRTRALIKLVLTNQSEQKTRTARNINESSLGMSHSQMLGKVEYGLPAKIWRLVGCTEMISW